MKTFHEWLRERQRMREGLWLGNDKLAQPGMSNINPLDQLKAKPVAKSLKRMPGIAHATPKA